MQVSPSRKTINEERSIECTECIDLDQNRDQYPMEELQTPEGEKLNFILLKVEMIVGPTANTFCSHNTNKTPRDWINQLVFQIKSSAREERLVCRPLQTHLSSHIYFNNKSREMKLI